AADLRRRVGLGVPRVELAGAADEEEHDAIDVGIGRRRGGLPGEETGEGQSERSQGAGVQEIAAGENVPKRDGGGGVESEHASVPSLWRRAAGRRDLLLLNVPGHSGRVNEKGGVRPPPGQFAPGSPAEVSGRICRVVQMKYSGAAAHPAESN